MRFLLVLIVVAFAGCGSPAENKPSTRDSHSEEADPAAGSLEESVRTPMDKAQNVENVLQDSADSRDAAIEEASDGT